MSPEPEGSSHGPSVAHVAWLEAAKWSWRTTQSRANDYFIPQTMLLLHFHTPNYKIISHHQKRGYDSIVCHFDVRI